MGYTIYHYDKDVAERCYFELTAPDGYPEIVFGGERKTELEAWADVPNYCNDPAASLEVQAKAIEVDSVGYVRNLEIAKWKKIMAPLARKEVSVLLNASPRERAEAAYITLQGAKGVEKIADR
ncbi:MULTISPECIES: hypothetical protein [unclassified Paenibacillus]|uniref:hypothetical protein n=1 Tax=unclassified Paenibacillus TaxID=185978 RepID=UPI002473BBD2|nr:MULTISPECIES: hypothetical protein [unclassified Paenibacillus]MDH6427246.1 hypothetical protein [Paenibacillus sp. PastH-4]MDH6443276.1 hypothetical protein [Paenibacillus sp. PastF-4]MDH6526020.1 hypothetical protein [Paenibacillus sp. PastH-3]